MVVRVAYCDAGGRQLHGVETGFPPEIGENRKARDEFFRSLEESFPRIAVLGRKPPEVTDMIVVNTRIVAYIVEVFLSVTCQLQLRWIVDACAS